MDGRYIISFVTVLIVLGKVRSLPTINKKKCGGDDIYHTGSMVNLSKVLEKDFNLIVDLQLHLGEIDRNMCGNSSLENISLPMYWEQQSNDIANDLTEPLIKHAAILDTYLDFTIKTYSILKGKDKKVTQLKMETKLRMDVRSTVQKFKEIATNVQLYCGQNSIRITEKTPKDELKRIREKLWQKMKNPTWRKIRRLIKKNILKQQRVCGNSITLIRRQLMDLQLIYQNIIADVKNRVNFIHGM